MESSSRTLVCSVLFLDIVEYSKKAVADQLQLKQAFNQVLGKALEEVPQRDRIILDTGDGAAVTFMGDPEDALFAAMSVRDMTATISPAGGMLGHGGMVLFDDSVDLARQARFAMEFCAVESCGKCTPCRIGSTRGVEIMDRIIAGRDVEAQTALLRDLCEVMTAGSLCALGGLTPLPVLSALEHFPEDFKRPVAAAAE